MKSNKEIIIKKNKKGKKAVIANLEKMSLHIYNQWGEKIYDSSEFSIGGIALLKVRQ